MARQVNDAGLNLIKSFEGLRLKAYRDTGGVPTIGYGHTRGVKMGMTINAAQALAFLKEDVAIAAAQVEKLVKVPLTDNQFGALTSFEYNCGELATSTLLKKLNAHDYASVASELNKWVHDNGRVIDGLVRRRKAEGQLFNTH